MSLLSKVLHNGLPWLLCLWLASPNPADAVPRFAYTANYFGSSISIYRVDAETGLLHHQSHVPAFKSPSTVLLHPTGKFLFTVSQTVDQIAIYRVDAQTGGLTEIPESPIPSRVRSAWQLAVSPDGKYLYVPGVFTASLEVFKINPESGALTPLLDKSLSTGGERVRFIETTPDGRFVYVGNTFSDSVAAFAVNTEKGRVTPVSGMPFASGSTPQGIMAHPNGKYLYIANWQAATLSAFSIDPATGGLARLPGEAVETGHFPFAGMTDPAGNFLYVANWGASTISGYRVDKQSGSLAPLPGLPVPSGGAGPVGVVVDAAGRFAYVPNHEGVSLTTFQVEPTSGQLVNPRSIYTRPGVRRLVLLEGDTPVRLQPGFLVAADASGNISSYAVSPETGELSPRGKQALGQTPGAVAVDPAGRFVYASDAARRVLLVFRLGQDGSLTPVSDATVTLEGLTRDLRVNQRGSHLYVVTEQPNRYLSFAIDADTGTLHPDEGVTLPGDSRPHRVVASPEERLSFVLDDASGRVFYYRYITSDAAPLMYELEGYGSPLALPTPAQDMAIDPTGLNALVIGKTGDLSVYRLPSVWGPLQPLGKGPIPAGKQPVAVAVHPRGGIVYVADAGSSTLRQFHFDADSGELTPEGEPVALSAVPAALDIDPSGRFAYVRYADKPGLTRFTLNAKSGRLETPRDLLDGVLPKSLAITTHWR